MSKINLLDLLVRTTYVTSKNFYLLFILMLLMPGHVLLPRGECEIDRIENSDDGMSVKWDR